MSSPKSPESLRNSPSTAAARRRERLRDEMRAEILQAARKLLSEDGLSALTMRAVADEIGYSVAALYEYFASKDDLCEALFFQGTQGLAGTMERAIAGLSPEATASDRLRAAGRAYREFAREHADLYLLIFTQQSPSGSISVAEDPEQTESFATLVQLVRQGIEQGDLDAPDSVGAAVSLWAFVHGFVMLELTGNLPAGSPDLLDELFAGGGQLLMRGLIVSNIDMKDAP